MEYHKIVLMPIEVTYGDYCWGDGRICEHFDSTGGHALCGLGFDLPKRDKEGRIPKPPECLRLKEKE